MLSRAHALRYDATPAERKLWQTIRNRQLDGLRFRRQVPLGPYIADFFCIAAQLVIELDGVSHIDSATDARRDAWMLARGIRVLRFPNADVLGNLEGVVTAINEFVRTTPPPTLGPLRGPSPQGEGESGSLRHSLFAPHNHV